MMKIDEGWMKLLRKWRRLMMVLGFFGTPRASPSSFPFYFFHHFFKFNNLTPGIFIFLMVNYTRGMSNKRWLDQNWPKWSKLQRG